MEMPEGYKRTYNEWNSHDPYFENRIKALDLMKEMAEALEYAKEIEYKYMSSIGIVYDGSKTIIKEALNRFKEWK